MSRLQINSFSRKSALCIWQGQSWGLGRLHHEAFNMQTVHLTTNGQGM